MDDLETTDRNLELFKTDKDALENWVEGRKKLLKELQAVGTPSHEGVLILTYLAASAG